MNEVKGVVVFCSVGKFRRVSGSGMLGCPGLVGGVGLWEGVFRENSFVRSPYLQAFPGYG